MHGLKLLMVLNIQIDITKPHTDLTRVYRDVLKYVHANSEYSQGTLLNRNNFLSLYQFIFFDLTKQRSDLKDSTVKLTVHYLSGGTSTAFSIYALFLVNKMLNLFKKMESCYLDKIFFFSLN